MTTWTAEKVLPAGTKDFSKPLWQMTLSLEGGETKIFKAGERDKETEAVFFQISDAGPVYQLSKYYFANLDKDDTYFQETPAPAASPKK